MTLSYCLVWSSFSFVCRNLIVDTIYTFVFFLSIRWKFFYAFYESLQERYFFLLSSLLVFIDTEEYVFSLFSSTADKENEVSFISFLSHWNSACPTYYIHHCDNDLFLFVSALIDISTNEHTFLSLWLRFFYLSCPWSGYGCRCKYEWCIFQSPPTLWP